MRASSTASASANSSLRVQLLGQLSSSLAPPPCVFTSFGMRAVDHLHTSLLQQEQTDPRSVFACAEILIKLNFTFRHVSDSGVFSGLTVCLVWHTHCQLTHSAASTFRGRNRIRNVHHIHILLISSYTLGQPTEFYDTFYSFFFSHSFSLVIQLNFCLVCVLIA